MKQKTIHYIPPAVSRHYRFDWQYAVDIYRQTSLRLVSLILFVVPLLLDIRDEIPFVIPLNVWFLWYSSVSFIISLLIITFFCPRFIREYRDFGQYQSRQHSHRWIVWEFHNTIESLQGWKNIVKETVPKGISYKVVDFKDEKIRAEVEKSFNEASVQKDVAIYKPININRDIYMPIELSGEKFVLFLEETDQLLPKKEQELFWILYSQAAKERVIARVIYWIFIYSSAILAFLPILNNIRKVLCH